MYAKLPSPRANKNLSALNTIHPAVSWRSRDMGSKIYSPSPESEPTDPSTIQVRARCSRSSPEPVPTVLVGVLFGEQAGLWSLRICVHLEPDMFYPLPLCHRASVTVACEVPSGDSFTFMSKQTHRSWAGGHCLSCSPAPLAVDFH